MEIPLFISGNMYENVTVDAWQTLWDKVCKMSYEGTNVCESIVTKPGILYINGEIIDDNSELTHSNKYANIDPVNDHLLKLDDMWKQYSKLYGTAQPKIIPEFKELVVPYPLYYCLGVTQWFRYSFPNCKVTYWNS